MYPATPITTRIRLGPSKRTPGFDRDTTSIRRAGFVTTVCSERIRMSSGIPHELRNITTIRISHEIDVSMNVIWTRTCRSARLLLSVREPAAKHQQEGQRRQRQADAFRRSASFNVSRMSAKTRRGEMLKTSEKKPFDSPLAKTSSATTYRHSKMTPDRPISSPAAGQNTNQPPPKRRRALEDD